MDILDTGHLYAYIYTEEDAKRLYIFDKGLLNRQQWQSRPSKHLVNWHMEDKPQTSRRPETHNLQLELVHLLVFDLTSMVTVTSPVNQNQDTRRVQDQEDTSWCQPVQLILGKCQPQTEHSTRNAWSVAGVNPHLASHLARSWRCRVWVDVWPAKSTTKNATSPCWIAASPLVPWVLARHLWHPR